MGAAPNELIALSNEMNAVDDGRFRAPSEYLVTLAGKSAARQTAVDYLHNGTEIQVRPRLIIGADGRASTVRKQSSIHINEAPATHVVAGLLAEGASRWPDDQYAIGVERDLQFYVFPQGSGRVRLYTCHANEQATRWAGRAGAQRFVEALAGLRSIPESLGACAQAVLLV